MQLPDFNEVSEFRTLRETMGVTRMVDLEPPDGWEALRTAGVDIEDLSEVEGLDDKTLSFEGHRILVYIRDQYLKQDGTRSGYRYHVAECRTLRKMREEKRFGRYVGTNRKDGVFIVNFFQGNEMVSEEEEVELLVCKNCLRELDWEGYEQSVSARRTQIWRDFSPDGFFEHFSTKVVCLPRHHAATAPINEYPETWPEISHEVRERAGWQCDQCNVVLSDPGLRRYLHVHHVDGNKPNTAHRNLQPLCIACHAEQPAHDRMKLSTAYEAFQREHPGSEPAG